MKNKNIIYLTIWSLIVFILIFFLGLYIRTGGSNILLATSLIALPTGFAIISGSYMLRNADTRVQLVWCLVVMILVRSVQLWWIGIDYNDEKWFIRDALKYFQNNELTEKAYLRQFPANIPFVGIFYALYLIWPYDETYELLINFLYPLLIIGYYLMTKEITQLFRESKPFIPAIMFLPFAPTLSIIPTYYWPKLLGLTTLFFFLAELLKIFSIKNIEFIQWIKLIAYSLLLVFSHSMSTALLLLTIIFLFISTDNKSIRWILLRLGSFVFLLYFTVHLKWNLKYIRIIVSSIQGSDVSRQILGGFNFTDTESIFRVGNIVSIAHMGFYIIVGLLILRLAYNNIIDNSLVIQKSSNRVVAILNLLALNTMFLSFSGFGVLSFIFAFFLSGLFLDPNRMMSWVALFTLPVVIPNEKRNALLFMTILLLLFFLLIWTTNAPWGSPFGNANGLSINKRVIQ